LSFLLEYALGSISAIISKVRLPVHWLRFLLYPKLHLMNSGAVVAAASAITMAGDPIKLFLLEQRQGPLAQFDGVCYNAPVLYLNSVDYAIGHAQADSYTGASGFHMGVRSQSWC
jgi:hypothetical protein